MAAMAACDISISIQSLKTTDVFCYICRGILIEPITVPCKHVFCKSCFECSMPETSYSCPLCRRRISNWMRSAKKCDKLLDTELWKQIQLQYKKEVAAKLSGQDDGLDKRLIEENQPMHHVTPLGEIRQEYTKLLQQYEEELLHNRNKEERASIEFIARLQEEELIEKEKDEQSSLALILRLQEEEKPISVRKAPRSLKITPSTSRGSGSSRNSSNQGKKSSMGPMDFHINRLSMAVPPKVSLLQRSLDPNRSRSSGSNDSIASEMHYFKPIRIVPKTPPKKLRDGTMHEVILRKITPVKLFTDPNCQTNIIASDMTGSIQSDCSAFKGKALPITDIVSEPSKKKSKLSIAENESNVLKEINFDENSDSNSISLTKCDHDGRDEAPIGFKITKITGIAFGAENVAGINELFDPEEKLKIEQRLVQEKADRELALKLSREWERYELRAPKQTRLITSYVQRRRKR